MLQFKEARAKAESKGSNNFAFKLTADTVRAYKAAGLWIDNKDLVFERHWNQKKMMEWATDFFVDQIKDVANLPEAAKFKNTVSPAWMKGKSVELLSPTEKWNGTLVARKGRLAGKSATAAAGRLALGMYLPSVLVFLSK